MSLKVRFGTRDDIDALVRVECSDVEAWYHFATKGRGDTASYDELTSWERTMHGGPWMDKAALTRYWETIERLGIVPLIAQIDGRVVGHLDVIFSDELPLGRFLYLDVLMVHKAYRRRGVAKTLIGEAERLARGRKVTVVLVQPQQYEGPSGLTYRSCGFEKAFDIYSLETPIDRPEVPTSVRLVSIPHAQGPPIKTHTMICGWYNISAKTWDYGVNPDVDDLRVFPHHLLTLAPLTSTRTYFFHVGQDRFDGSSGSLRLWAPTPLKPDELRCVLQAARTVASWLGIRSLATKSIERYVGILENQGFIVKSKTEPFLIKRL